MDITTESLAARCFVEKTLTAAQYTRAAEAMTNYNHGLAAQLAAYAAQDTQHAELFASLALMINEMTVYESADTIALIFIPAEINDEITDSSRNAASTLVQNLCAIEHSYKEFWRKIHAHTKECATIDQVITINGMFGIAHTRTIELEKMKNAINFGTLWNRDSAAPFFCARCGATYYDENDSLSATAFSECETCHAPQNFCSLPFNLI